MSPSSPAVAVELVRPYRHLLDDGLLGILDVRVDGGVVGAQVVAVARAGDEDGGRLGRGLDRAGGAELAGHRRRPPRVELAVHPEQALGVVQVPALRALVEHRGRLALVRAVRVIPFPREEELALALPVLGARQA